ncbi:MAG TPA: methyl-galactoside ABC transporter substrate-binding protein, partial [Sphaerochaeta sp.]|nr:methyl-galactoside ABC transporter substrate-binding protein [Sphaerochaeta sp.]
MRKVFVVLCLALVIATPVFAQGKTEAGTVTIGSAIYKFDDTFMTGVKNAIVAAAAETSDAKV